MVMTAHLRHDFDRYAPGGNVQIRPLVTSDRGDLVHALCPRGSASRAGWNRASQTELLYVHSGSGKFWWRGSNGVEETVNLRPGRALHIPPGIVYAYVASRNTDLVMFVGTTPPFDVGRHRLVGGGPWDSDGAEAFGNPPDTAEIVAWKDLTLLADYAAPDGSEIRLLPEHRDGGLSRATVQPGLKTRTVRHFSVVELWVALDGAGEVARWTDGADKEPILTPLTFGVSVDIPLGVPFQFTCTGTDPLTVLILTMPRWPGPTEADPSVAELDAWPSLT